jgi:hypothetical protein
MQAYTGSEMPSNAANVFKTIDDFMRGGPLNPGKVFAKMMADKSDQSVPVLLCGGYRNLHSGFDFPEHLLTVQR